MSERVSWGESAYAGFWRRFAGYLIDGLILSFVTGLLAGFFAPPVLVEPVDPQTLQPQPGVFPAFAGWSSVGAVIFIAYETAMLSTVGWTLGKRVVGVEVRGAGGAVLSVPRALGRVLGKYISALPLFLGFLWAAWDPRKQAWHDKFVSSYALKQSATTPAAEAEAEAQHGTPSGEPQRGPAASAWGIPAQPQAGGPVAPSSAEHQTGPTAPAEPAQPGWTPPGGDWETPAPQAGWGEQDRPDAGGAPPAPSAEPERPSAPSAEPERPPAWEQEEPRVPEPGQAASWEAERAGPDASPAEPVAPAEERGPRAGEEAWTPAEHEPATPTPEPEPATRDEAAAQPPAAEPAAPTPPAAGPPPATDDPNRVAITRAGVAAASGSWLEQVAGQVDPRLDRVAPGWQSAPQAAAARACAFGLLLGYLASTYPHMSGDIARVAEAHPSFATLGSGNRLQTLQEIANDPPRATAWLGPLIGVEDPQQLRRLFE